MKRWTKEIENEISLLLKDWLKQQGKTQKDLKKSLNASSERMNALIEVLHNEYLSGGIPKVAARLCEIESNWSNLNQTISGKQSSLDPFSQLDLLLEELQEDCKP